MSPWRKILAVLLVISGLTVVVMGVSVAAYPQWLTVPSGLVLLAAAAFAGIADLPSKLKDWSELLFGGEKKDSDSSAEPSAAIVIKGNKQDGDGNEINVRREGSVVEDNEQIGQDNKIDVGAKPGPKRKARPQRKK